MRRAVYPGTFDPPTVAHLAVADAAMEQAGMDRVELVVSRQPLGKGDGPGPVIAERMAVLDALVASRPWLSARVTDLQLLADIAADADAVILGADKWEQVVDPAWYGGDAGARDRALARLPLALVAPRPPSPLPPAEPGRVQRLLVDAEHAAVSSTAVRDGEHRWMAAEARASGLWVRDRRESPE